ncbi:hypothetical protein SUGI_0388620 [Cryptomeria japonica]|nr:hypothetical protein SUGI_0388620 [Cryptomeria japonica]
MLRREQEIQSARFCEILEQRNKMQNEIEGRNNEIVQHEDLIEQLSNANEEIRILKEQNESLKNELDIQKQANERMMKSQTDLDQLNEQNLHKQKGKAGLGYNEEGESSEQGSQRNQRPTCNYCAKNNMNTKKVEDEKKAKADNIRKQMRQQWVPKSTEQDNSSNGPVTQELGDPTITN